MFKRFLLSCCLVLALPLTAAAQQIEVPTDKYTRPDGIRDQFIVRLGFYFPNHNTFARLQPSGLPEIPGFDLETDTAFPDSTTDFRAEVGFKLGRRHKLRVGYVDMNRDTSTTLDAEIEWGDETFPVSAEINGTWDTRVLKFDYRYALIKSDRVDFGLGLGVFLMRISSGFGLAGQEEIVAEDVRKSAPLPMLGGDIEWLLADRWLLRGGAQYLGISIDDTVDGSWLEARASIEFNASRNFGLGAGWLLADIDVAAQFAEARFSELEYSYKFNGPTIYAFANF